jgi:cardiolipin synthase
VTLRTDQVTPVAPDTRELLSRCCGGHCAPGDEHGCERVPDVSYASLADPGRLDPTGTLAPAVQARLRAIAGCATTVRNRVQLLVDGVQSYGAMLSLVRSAEAEILFENFILRSDAIGTAFAGEMHRQAGRGIDVRVLLDPFGTRLSLLPLRRTFLRSDAEVRLYNPPRPTPAFLRLGRDHRKVLIQDGTRVVTGGMCLADIWVGNCISECTWRDSAVLAEGEVAAEIVGEFRRMWARGWRFAGARGGTEAAHREPSRDASRRPRVGEIPIRMIAGHPGERRAEQALLVLCEAAAREILVTNSYFAPPPAVLAALAGAARRGVDIQIVLPGTSDHPIVDLTVEELVGPLLRAGVRVWRWRGPMIHAKTVVVDRCWSLIGSTNLDAFSLWRNAELDLEIHGTAFGEQVADMFARDVERCDAVTIGEWTRRGTRRRWLTRAAAATWRWQ